MAEKLRGPFEKFVDWQQCAAVMQREALFLNCFMNLENLLVLIFSRSAEFVG
jgi:hypothetical protein